MKDTTSPAAGVLLEHRPNVLPLEGDIDLHVSPVITETLNAMIKKKPERIVIDLSRATYIDSAGVAALILAMQEVEAYGGKFFLSGLQETLRLIFETSRLEGGFQIFPDVEAALAYRDFMVSNYSDAGQEHWLADRGIDLLRGIVTLSPISGIGGGSAAAGWAVGFLRGLAMTPSAYSCESEGILKKHGERRRMDKA